MRIYFAPSRIPELASLNDSYRRFVLDRAYLLVRKEAPLLNYTPMILCFLTGFGGWLGGPYLFVSLFGGDPMFLSICGSQGGGMIGGMFGGCVGTALMRHRLRSSVRQILADDDISISNAG